MPKMFPDFKYKEQVDIHKLIGTINDLISSWDEYYSHEEVDEIKNGLYEEIENANKKSFVALRIPLLNITEIREGMSLSDYIIYLIILETNLQGKFFDEENKYISIITGIESAQVSNSIRKLIRNDFIYYVDRYGQLCYAQKPKTEKKAYKIMSEQSEKGRNYSFININNKRVLVINPEVFENLSQEQIKITQEERAEARKKARREKMAEDRKRQNLFFTYTGLTLKLKISVDNIKKCMDDEFKKKHPKIIEDIQKELKDRSVNIEDLMQFIDRMKTE